MIFFASDEIVDKRKIVAIFGVSEMHDLCQWLM
jgi:hypothetical protein